MSTNPLYEGNSSYEPPAFDTDDRKAAVTAAAGGPSQHQYAQATPAVAPDADASVDDLVAQAAEQARQRAIQMRTFLSEIDPVLMQYANKLCENGFETPKLFSFAQLEDFQKLDIPLGHQRALNDAARNMRGANDPEDAINKPENQLQQQKPYVVHDVGNQQVVIAGGQFEIQHPNALNPANRNNPQNVKEMGKSRRDVLISALVFLGLGLVADIVELGIVASQCIYYGLTVYDPYYGYFDYDRFCVNTLTTGLGVLCVFVAFIFALVALRVPCVTGVCGAAFVAPPVQQGERHGNQYDGDCSCCTDPDACGGGQQGCCMSSSAQDLPIGRRPRPMRFKTALRTSYVMTLLSFPCGWWYGWLPVEIFAAFELRLVAFILLTVADCM